MTQFEVKNLSKMYGNVIALKDVSLTFEFGKNLAILGPSGCGKSTLLRLLAGLDFPSAGSILFSEKEISSENRVIVPPHLRNISVVFQDLGLWPNLNVIQNITVALSKRFQTEEERLEQAKNSLELCKISSLKDRKLNELSGGQLQRVAISRAISVKPKFLFLDEPFSGLDIVLKMHLIREIAELCKEIGSTILLITHDPLEARLLCKDAIVLSEGRIVERGSFKELERNSKSEIFQAFQNYF